jgi:hypothetical protein
MQISVVRRGVGRSSSSICSTRSYSVSTAALQAPVVTLQKLEHNVCVITLDDGKVNVFSPTMIQEFNAYLDEVPLDSGALVIRGRPGFEKYCMVLHRNASHCIALYRTASHCIALHRTASHCMVLYRAA